MLSYTLGLRHALDADHISAIDLMTRRLIASGQRPVTVGTFFSLGHSTIVVITSIVVAATAAGVAGRFDRFSTIGGIIGSSVSAAFLILLGLMNCYILVRLVGQMRKVLRLSEGRAEEEGWKVEGGGCLFRVLKGMFRLIDRPWKMYPLGVLFGLGFDTSSEIALLGIASIQGTKGTSIWLILIFPVLFTAGMCLLDTLDGALMLTLYIMPGEVAGGGGGANGRAKDPIMFLYYSIVLTCLTVVVAMVIGVIQLLTMVLNVTDAKGRFWDGVEGAGDNYDIIGGGICASFVVFGGMSVVLYRPWRRWADQKRRIWNQGEQLQVDEEEATREEDIAEATIRTGQDQKTSATKKSVEVFEIIDVDGPSGTGGTRPR